MGRVTKKQWALLIFSVFVSTAYAVYAAKRLGFWAAALYITVWMAVFWWARTRKRL